MIRAFATTGTVITLVTNGYHISVLAMRILPAVMGLIEIVVLVVIKSCFCQCYG